MKAGPSRVVSFQRDHFKFYRSIDRDVFIPSQKLTLTWERKEIEWGKGSGKRTYEYAKGRELGRRRIQTK